MIARLVLLLVAATAVVCAQPPRGFFPWWNRPIVRDLNLSQPQMRQIRQTVRESGGRLIESRAALNQAEIELQNALEDEKIDQKRVDAAVENLAHARENLTRVWAQMTVRLRLVLTQEQWKELQKRLAGMGAEKKALQRP